MSGLTKKRIGDLEIEIAHLRNAERPSLRDQFAMAALTGLASGIGTPPSVAAIEAYAFADAMMIERGRVEREQALASEYYDNMLQTIEDTLQEEINANRLG